MKRIMKNHQAHNCGQASRVFSETQNASIADTARNVIALRPGILEHHVMQPQPDEDTRSLVRRLRLLLQQSLLRPRQDWDKACMLIAAEPNVTLDRYAAAFFHGLEVHGRRTLHFFMPQADEISDDEMWMFRLITQLQAEDEMNARYLIALRVEPAGRRRILFLAGGLARWLAVHEAVA
jgi:hypothetical protein